MTAGGQKLLLEGRKYMEVSGVSSVDSFDSETIELTTSLGGLSISGEDLKIGNLNLEDGQLNITGTISALVYGKSREERSGRARSKNLISRILK